ncbi:hypothetical protein CYMTET_7153 [Cymbomonas tetramitiformis]|uniref:Uncharacterized protein n=1 Tax=Cymbomonas tetramitiformis TaxID=36881 RepID=A0AAE0LHQ7_9CHLO|nr:hypothetical protein CYMTET_7153 [Cymbomonas tetramitiformis]
MVQFRKVCCGVVLDLEGVDVYNTTNPANPKVGVNGLAVPCTYSSRMAAFSTDGVADTKGGGGEVFDDLRRVAETRRGRTERLLRPAGCTRPHVGRVAFADPLLDGQQVHARSLVVEQQTGGDR